MYRAHDSLTVTVDWLPESCHELSSRLLSENRNIHWTHHQCQYVIKVVQALPLSCMNNWGEPKWAHTNYVNRGFSVNICIYVCVCVYIVHHSVYTCLLFQRSAFFNCSCTCVIRYDATKKGDQAIDTKQKWQICKRSTQSVKVPWL